MIYGSRINSKGKRVRWETVAEMIHITTPHGEIDVMWDKDNLWIHTDNKNLNVERGAGNVLRVTLEDM